MTAETYFKQYMGALTATLESLTITDLNAQQMGRSEGIDAIVQLSKEVQAARGKQILCGNGASAAFADHMALDWTKNGKLPSLSFGSSAILSAISNDLGSDRLFASTVEWYGHKGDLLTVISSSGNSPNIIEAVKVAREQGMRVVTLTGLKPDNTVRALGDLNIYISALTYGMVESAHQILLHMWLDRFMGVAEWNQKEHQDMRETRTPFANKKLGLPSVAPASIPTK